VEVGPEDVLDVVRVGGDDGAARAEPVNDDGPGRGSGEEVGVPVEKVGTVPVEREETSYDGMRRRAVADTMRSVGWCFLADALVNEGEEGVQDHRKP